MRSRLPLPLHGSRASLPCLSRVLPLLALVAFGAVFHPVAYLLNLPAIRQAEASGRPFSFYVEGIANNPEVGPVVEEVDQIRLRIARAFGCPVYGLREGPREREWREVMARVNRLEADPPERLR